MLPPQGCEYLSPDEVHVIVDGLPIGATIELAPIHKDFICDPGYGGLCTIPLPPGTCEGPGGGLGGNVPSSAVATAEDSIIRVPRKAETETERKVRTSLFLPQDLVERWRNAAWYLRRSQADVLAEALGRELDRLEKRHHDGQSFPKKT